MTDAELEEAAREIHKAEGYPSSWETMHDAPDRDSYRAMARVAYAVFERQRGWREIDDEARNGKPVILACFRNNGFDPIVVNSQWIKDDEYGNDDHWLDWDGFPEPTHYMPLIAPPAPKEDNTDAD